MPAATARSNRTCSAPDCTRPRGSGACGAYCPDHHAEVQAIRRTLTRLLKPTPAPRVRVPAAHHDPRGDRRR